MNRTSAIPHYELADYLAREPDGDVRHEYIDGEIFAMVGSSREHNLIATNLAAMLRPHLRGTRCRLSVSDMKVLIRDANRVYYPDVMVCCNDPSSEEDRYTETQPLLIIEVLSPSTESVDRKQKRLDYRHLFSLVDYVLVAQDEPLVELYHRTPDGKWLRTLCTDIDGQIELKSVDLMVAMTQVYEDVIGADNLSMRDNNC